MKGEVCYGGWERRHIIDLFNGVQFKSPHIHV